MQPPLVRRSSFRSQLALVFQTIYDTGLHFFIRPILLWLGGVEKPKLGKWGHTDQHQLVPVTTPTSLSPI